MQLLVKRQGKYLFLTLTYYLITLCIHKYSGTKSHSKNNYLELYSNNSFKVLKCSIAYELLYTNICKINADILLGVQSIQRPVFSFCHIFKLIKSLLCVCVCDNVPATNHMYMHPIGNKRARKAHVYALATMWAGHKVLALSVRTFICPFVILCITIVVSAIPPTVFDAGI